MKKFSLVLLLFFILIITSGCSYVSPKELIKKLDDANSFTYEINRTYDNSIITFKINGDLLSINSGDSEYYNIKEEDKYYQVYQENGKWVKLVSNGRNFDNLLLLKKLLTDLELTWFNKEDNIYHLKTKYYDNFNEAFNLELENVEMKIKGETIIFNFDFSYDSFFENSTIKIKDINKTKVELPNIDINAN